MNATTSTSSNRRTLYLVLVVTQTIGASMLLMKGVPIYRQLFNDLSQLDPQAGIWWWAIGAVLLIQTAYWLRVRLRLHPPMGGNVLIGHIASFVARLSFILASSTFAAVFLARFDQLSLPPHRILMVLIILFSMFCYTLELERIARSLLPGEARPPRRAES